MRYQIPCAIPGGRNSSSKHKINYLYAQRISHKTPMCPQRNSTSKTISMRRGSDQCVHKETAPQRISHKTPKRAQGNSSSKHNANYFYAKRIRSMCAQRNHRGSVTRHQSVHRETAPVNTTQTISTLTDMTNACAGGTEQEQLQPLFPLCSTEYQIVPTPFQEGKTAQVNTR